MAEVKYVGSVKTRDTQFGEIISIGLSKDNLQMLMDNLNERGYVNVDILNGKEGGKYAKINDYNPSSGGDSKPKEKTVKKDVEKEIREQEERDDLPF